MGDSEKVRGGVERKRHARGLFFSPCGIRAVFENEAAADGEEGALIERRAGGIECGEAQAVGMLRGCAGREHDVAVEEQVTRFVE